MIPYFQHTVFPKKNSEQFYFQKDITFQKDNNWIIYLLLINFLKAEYVPSTGLFKMIFSEISFYTKTSQNMALTHPSLPKQAGWIIGLRSTWSSDSIGQSKISDGRNSIYSTTHSPCHTQLHPTFRCVISNTTFLLEETWYLGKE